MTPSGPVDPVRAAVSSTVESRARDDASRVVESRLATSRRSVARVSGGPTRIRCRRRFVEQARRRRCIAITIEIRRAGAGGVAARPRGTPGRDRWRARARFRNRRSASRARSTEVMSTVEMTKPVTAWVSSCSGVICASETRVDHRESRSSSQRTTGARPVRSSCIPCST